MAIIVFLKTLVIIIGFSLPAAYVGEIIGGFAGAKLWERSVRKTRGYTNNGILTR